MSRMCTEGWSCRYPLSSTDQNSRLSEGKWVFNINQIVCIEFRHSETLYQLWNCGNILKIQVPYTNEELNFWERPKDSNLGSAILTCLCTSSSLMQKNKEQVMLFLGFYSQRQWSTKNKSQAVLIDKALDCTNLFPWDQASYASKRNYLGTKVGNTINSKLYLIYNN